jgi:hypothetical protein
MPGALPFPAPDPEGEQPDQVADSEESYVDPYADGPLAPEQPELPRAEPASEAELPPEARGETNGGPLGCCLGITVGIMFCLFLGVIGVGQLLASGIVPLLHGDAITTTRIATAILASVGAILGGFAGWKIGKRLYREYELSPRQKRRLEQLEKKYRSSPGS